MSKTRLKEREKPVVPSWIEAENKGVTHADNASGIDPGAKKPLLQGEWISDNIVRCSDGVYRWVYELNLLKNPTIFFLIWKIFFIILTAMFVLMTAYDAFDWSRSLWESLRETAPMYGCLLLGMTGLTTVGYLVYAAIMGGKYCVLFEMDEKGVNHKQMPKQAQKARLLSELTMMAGVKSGSMSAVSAGAAGARTEMYSDFAYVRKVKPHRLTHVIKVNERLGHNQVYAAAEDFDFVRDYIINHCPNLK